MCNFCVFWTKKYTLGNKLSITLANSASGAYLLDFFCSSILFYLLLSPYFSFISLLYLDLYVLEADALLS